MLFARLRADDDQYRVVFRFDGHDAYDVRCTDYH
jgi:plasmid maintenance system killer protein